MVGRAFVEAVKFSAVGRAFIEASTFTLVE